MVTTTSKITSTTGTTSIAPVNEIKRRIPNREKKFVARLQEKERVRSSKVDSSDDMIADNETRGVTNDDTNQSQSCSTKISPSMYATPPLVSLISETMLAADGTTSPSNSALFSTAPMSPMTKSTATITTTATTTTTTTSRVALAKCVCCWKNCHLYQKAFRQIQHPIFDGVIKIKIIQDHPESMAYQECLHRTLGIKQEPEWKDSTSTTSKQPNNPGSNQQFCKYTVAKHHFTAQHIQKYETHKKTFSFVKPFSYHGAKKYLYRVDPREIYIAPKDGRTPPSTDNDLSEASYLQCPNVPSDIVKVEYHKIVQSIKQQRKQQQPQLQVPSIPESQATIDDQQPQKQQHEQEQQQQQQQAVHQQLQQQQQQQQQEEQQTHFDPKTHPQHLQNSQQPQNAQHPLHEQQQNITFPQLTLRTSIPHSGIQSTTVNSGVTTNLSDSSMTTSVALQGSTAGSSQTLSASIIEKALGISQGAMTRVPESTEIPNDAMINYRANVNYYHMMIQREEENKMLRDQLHTMKGQVALLQQMLEKIQAKQFETSSVHSGRYSQKSKGTFATNSSSHRNNYSKKKTSSLERHGSNKKMSSVSSHQTIEDDDDDDDEFDQTTISRTLDDLSEVQTIGTGMTFQSKFKNLSVGEDDNSEGDEEEEEYSYADCVSLGTSTILSASRSVKSLPRERELEEDDENNSSDEGESVQDHATYRSWSVVSGRQQPSFDGNSSIQSGNTFASPKPRKNQRPPHPQSAKGSTLAATRRRQQVAKFGYSSIGSIESKQNSSTCSSTASNTLDYSQDVIPISASQANTTTATITESLASPSSTFDQSRNRPLSPDSVSHSSPIGLVDEVKALCVTDPYGEKGTYTGQISKASGMPHGYGRLEYDEAGRWYEGDWKHGRWTGYGRLSNGDGDYYEGGVKDDLKHGRGYMRFADGRTFEGRYNNGQMVQGKMTYEDGSTYDGEWAEGIRHGYGRCVFADDSVYEGEFKEGEFCGHGKMIWTDGGWYEGTWSNGEMHGFGKELRADGSLRHHGEWWRGQPVRHNN